MIHLYINFLNENIISRISWRQVQRVIDKKGLEPYKNSLKQNNKPGIKVKLIFFSIQNDKIIFFVIIL